MKARLYERLINSLIRKVTANHRCRLEKVGGQNCMMTAGQAAISNNCRWKTKINRNTKKKSKSGFAIPALIVFVFLFLAGTYVYCINSNATKGYKIKQIEKEIAELKKENESLRIREAELKSLYHIEESSKNLNMAQTLQVSYLEEKSPVAMK